MEQIIQNTELDDDSYTFLKHEMPNSKIKRKNFEGGYDRVKEKII